MICDRSYIGRVRHYLHEILQKAPDINYDGLMIETHCDTDKALSDAARQLTPNDLKELMSRLILRSTGTDDKKLPDILGELRQQIDVYNEHLIDLM